MPLHIPPAPLVIPPPNVRPVPPMGGGGSPSDGPPQPQFHCNRKKTFLWRLWRLVFPMPMFWAK